MTKRPALGKLLLSEAPIVVGANDEPITADDIPVCADDRRGFLYVVSFSNGHVKPGRTSQPRHRLTDYVSSAAVWDVSVAKVWLSEDFRDYVDAERDLREWVGAEFSMIGTSEYYRDADHDRVVALAKAAAAKHVTIERTQPPPVTISDAAHALRALDSDVRRLVREGHLAMSHRQSQFITGASWAAFVAMLESGGVVERRGSGDRPRPRRIVS